MIAAAMAALSFVPWVGWLLAPLAAGAILQRWYDADLSAAAIVVLRAILVLRIAEWSMVAVLLAERGR